jgi:hypothetical protein
MGIILKCGESTMYISLLNWTNFKMYVLFLTFQIIGQIYPNLFRFIDERLEIFERIDEFKSITNFESITHFENITDLVSLQNIHKNQIILFPSIFIEYVNANCNNVTNLKLNGVYDLFNNTSVYDLNHCKNIFIALKVLNSHICIDITKPKDFNKINRMFEYSWTNKQNLCIL